MALQVTVVFTAGEKRKKEKKPSLTHLLFFCLQRRVNPRAASGGGVFLIVLKLDQQKFGINA